MHLRTVLDENTRRPGLQPVCRRHFAFVIAAFSGFIAGWLHVLSGPDHLAAVAPLAIESRRRSWLVGLRWGLGHAAGVAVVGVLSLLARDALPIDLFSSWCERGVGIVLIGVGIWGVRRALSTHVHEHEHVHDGHRHLHVHVHSPKHSHSMPRAHAHSHAPLLIGALHGFAGSSHFWAVLPAFAFASQAEGLIYLASYGVGTILAMTSFSAAAGRFVEGLASSGTQSQAYRALMLGGSGAAMVVGGFWLFL